MALRRKTSIGSTEVSRRNSDRREMSFAGDSEVNGRVLARPNG